MKRKSCILISNFIGFIQVFFQKILTLNTHSKWVSFGKFSLAVFASFLLLISCSSTPPPTQPKKTLQAEDPDLILWPFEEKAITIYFKTDKDLNLYDRRAHSLELCIYQIDNSRKFVELAKTPEGIETLLKAQPFGDEVKGIDRFFLQPNEKGVFYLDRVEGANKIGIVAGYFDAKKYIAKVWPIQPVEHKPGMSFWKPTTYSAGQIELNLRFTATRMVEVKALSRYPDRKDKIENRDDIIDDDEEDEKNMENASYSSDLT